MTLERTKDLIHRLVHSLLDYFRIIIAPYYHRIALRRLIGKEKIRCVFLVLNEAGWKYDSVFRRMLDSVRFEPIILICPHVGYGHEYMVNRINSAVAFFKSKGYPTIVSYDEITQKYINVKSDLRPDILFYCTPYSYTIDKRYYITNNMRILSVYVPYAFNNSCDYKAFHDELLHNLVWRYYAETEEHKEYSEKNARNKGKNVVVAGYPGIEAYLGKAYKPSSSYWKNKNRSLKRIIWAPHHTIENKGTVIFSCFLKYCDVMIDLAKKYNNCIQFVLKPHPLLRVKLERKWGKEKTDTYFKTWEQMSNTFYSESNYVDLFLTSDAMIHDCGSFIAEYLYLNKPVLRTMNDYPVEQMYNGFTQQCLDHYYKAFTADDIENFIINVLNNNDPMKEGRTNFIKEKLLPSNGRMPSENIVNDIIDSIDNQVLFRS